MNLLVTAYNDELLKYIYQIILEGGNIVLCLHSWNTTSQQQ